MYDLVEAVSKSLPLNLFNVTQVELAVKMGAHVGKPAKTHTLRIAYPNSCNLKYDELDLTLRDMLEASGIEPRSPPVEAARAA